MPEYLRETRKTIALMTACAFLLFFAALASTLF